jgi:signal transduction histidine kinase/CheY-like chemotaxis protein
MALFCIGLFVATLTIFSHLLIKNSSDAANLISLATHQYMLPKQIVLQQNVMLSSIQSSNSHQIAAHDMELNELINKFEKNHLNILKTLPHYKSSAQETDVRGQMGFSGTPTFSEITRQFIESVRVFSQDYKVGKTPSIASDDIITRLMSGLNKTVLQLENEANDKLGFLIQLEWIFLAATILLLFLVSLFMIKPVETLIDRSVNNFRRSKQTLSNSKANSDIQAHFLVNNRHEFRTHISSMFGMIELAKQESDKDMQTNLLQKAHAAGKQLLSLIDNLGDISRIESNLLQLSNVDFELPKLLDDCLSTVAFSCEKNGVEFRYEALSPLPLMVVGDPVRLTQVINNLVSNAIKFTPLGSIKVTTDIRVKDKSLMFEFVIEDTGVGIGEDDLDRIFEKFTQVQNKQKHIFNGSGLGLVLTKALVEKMGGTIAVRSTISKGSLFKVSVPLAKSNQLAMTSLTTINTKNNMGIKFAVVDDLETSRDYIDMILKNEGYEVDTFNSGADILRLTAAVKQYSAIIIDIHMPGLSGYELADILQAMHGDSCPSLIFISASIESLSGARKGEYRHSSQAFAKPINKDRFIDAIKIVASGRIEPSPSLQKVNVLVVEDEPINAEIVKTMLGKMGHHVHYAATAKEAIDIAVRDEIDIILMDINLPDFSGIEATRIILNEHKIKVPIIALTANSFEEDRLATKEAGMSHHLTKPVHFDELQDVVHSTTSK